MVSGRRSTGSLRWEGGITPSIVLENWSRPALEAAAEEFGRHLATRGGDAWYSVVREDTGTSGAAWAAAISPDEITIIGTDYARYVNVYYGGVLEDLWSAYDVNAAIRRRGVEP